MPNDGSKTPVEAGLIARVTQGVRYILSGTVSDGFFGPGQPLPPVAQDDAVGRAFDYPFGVNTRIQPRTTESVTFAQMRALADSYDLLRLVIETRKYQLAAMPWSIGYKDSEKESDDTCKALQDFLQYPDREHSWDQWLRMLLEDMFVIDAATIYPRMNRGGGLYSLELVDGATIKRVLDDTGRTPMAPDPAYQQVIKGLNAVNYSRDELIYMPRNPRTSRIYGYSQVEQIIMTVNIALRRQAHQLQFYTEGNLPDALITTPDTWQPDQIRQFQMWFNSILEGNTAARRKALFVPHGVEVHDVKEGAIGDGYDEWLARVICYAFSVSPTAFVAQVNRATAQTSQETAQAEGLLPVMRWVKGVMDYALARYMGAAESGIEFKWGEPDKVSPVEQASIHKVYLDSKVLTPNEVREDLGLDPLSTDDEAKLNPPAPNALVDQSAEKSPPASAASAEASKLSKKKVLWYA